MSKDKKVKLIDDPRLRDYTKRTRNGSKQVFYTGSDSRDFDRYRSEGGHKDQNVEMHDKIDTINIEAPERNYYSELIDGEWWWVNGCAECNGEPRDWSTYIECDKHNVCRTCAIHRSKLTDIPWGGKSGWQCKPCADVEHEIDKEEALAVMPDEYDEWNYQGLDEIKCPHCNYEFSDSFESADDSEEDHECPRCNNTFIVTAEYSLNFTCKRKES